MADSLSAVAYTLATHFGGFAPHAICLLYDPAILAAELTTNLVVAVSYFLIPIALLRLLRSGVAVPYRSLVILFMLFIIICGLSHITRIIALFLGGWTYWLDDAVTGVTAIISMLTALLLFRHGATITRVLMRLLARRNVDAA